MNRHAAQRLRASLEIDVSTKGIYTRPPTEVELSRYESEEGIRLPSSYRAFALVFGPGELAGIFRIAVPYCKVAAFNLGREIKAHKRQFVGKMGWLRKEKYGDPDRVQRMLVFSTTYRGEKYAWDPVEVTDGRAHEYQVYLLSRSGSVETIAQTFGDFVTEYCLGQIFPRFYSDDVRTKTFAPAYLRRRKKTDA